MPQRVSHSLLDPWLGPAIKSAYPRLRIPAAFPPEGIILIGHLSAIAAAFGFAFSVDHWWGGLLAALGVAGNHIADVLDGTHARATRQCRNGGELLDHFTDPLSFSYYIVGISVACGRLDLGLVGVICLYATAVLTSIKAKMTGEFALQTFGPTEFKALLIAFGLGLSVLTPAYFPWISAKDAAFVAFSGLIGLGVVQLAVMLVRAVREVNALGGPPDTSEWVTRASQSGRSDAATTLSVSHPANKT